MNNIWDNKSGFMTKTNMLFVTIIFYSTLIVFIGFINSYFVTSVSYNTTTQDFTALNIFGGNPECNCGTLTCTEYALIHGQNATDTLCQLQLSQESDTSFLSNIITGISMIPWWLNVILFGSLVFIIGWIFVSSLPTFNGGS